jgi:hypothetical protein
VSEYEPNDTSSQKGIYIISLSPPGTQGYTSCDASSDLQLGGSDPLFR